MSAKSGIFCVLATHTQWLTFGLQPVAGFFLPQGGEEKNTTQVKVMFGLCLTLYFYFAGPCGLENS